VGLSVGPPQLRPDFSGCHPAFQIKLLIASRYVLSPAHCLPCVHYPLTRLDSHLPPSPRSLTHHHHLLLSALSLQSSKIPIITNSPVLNHLTSSTTSLQDVSFGCLVARPAIISPYQQGVVASASLQATALPIVHCCVSAPTTSAPVMHIPSQP
jgi:hypothetical protein